MVPQVQHFHEERIVPPPNQILTVEKVQMIVLEMMKPFDMENKLAIREVADAVDGLKIAMARWSGGIAVLVVLLGVLEGLTSGACGSKMKIAVEDRVQSQKSSQVTGRKASFTPGDVSLVEPCGSEEAS